ncbi:MAG: hypothetical protein QOG04_1454 [Actinomycetota bacterium]|nr:hypothetical protein [Actinomycetota bacterium]
MEIQLDSVQERENCLTVVRGCVGTVIANWDRLDDGMKKTLLETALNKTEDLVRNLENDVRPLRLSDDELNARRQPSPTATIS